MLSIQFSLFQATRPIKTHRRYTDVDRDTLKHTKILKNTEKYNKTREMKHDMQLILISIN